MVLTFENITFGVAILGAIFGVYHFFKNPNIKNSEQLKLLEQNISLSRSTYDKLAKISQNHLHTIEENVKTNTNTMNNLAIQINKLETIINERIPKNN